MSVMVTGANGFVGSAMCSRLLHTGFAVRPVVRSVHNGASSIYSLQHVIADLELDTDWTMALANVSAVMHLAARVHIMSDQSSNSLAAYRKVNVDATLNLARQAAKAGVRRFVFVSSIKVNGEVTQPGTPFTADDVPAPSDPYGVSKLEAELCLRKIEEQTGMEVVIVRPPLVYGPGVKANFAAMMHLVSLGIPLPLGAIHNVRSLIALDNLVDFLTICLHHPAAAGQTFLVSDGEDLSTTDLFRRTAKAMGKKPLLLPVPVVALRWGASLLGKRAVAQRLFGSLQVDITKTRRLLSWNPPLSLDQGLKIATKEYA